MTTVRLSPVVFLLLSFVHLSVSYLTGPPVSMNGICQSMMPQHGVNATPGPPPFNMTFSASCYRPGQVLTVTIAGQNSTLTMTGFLVEARKTVDGTYSYGVFDIINNDPNVKPLDCFCGLKNAIGHFNPNDSHWQQRQFTWTPPTGLGGDIVFVTTLIKGRQVFWHNWENHISPCDTSVPDTATVPACPTSSTQTSSIGRSSTTVFYQAATSGVASFATLFQRWTMSVLMVASAAVGMLKRNA